jgi:hypothetical protein
MPDGPTYEDCGLPNPYTAKRVIEKQIAEIGLLRELKTPASRQLLNITKALLDVANADNAKLRVLVRALLDNDPDDMAADGVTVLMAWRKEARRALEAGSSSVNEPINDSRNQDWD